MSKTKEIIILLIVVAVAAAGWWWQKSNIPSAPPPVPEKEGIATTTSEVLDTTNWLTYRNEKYGFEFKYPRGYQIGRIVTGGEQIGDSIMIWDAKYANSGPGVLIFLPTNLFNSSANPKATSLVDYSGDYKTEYFDVIIHQQEVKRWPNGLEALKQIYSVGKWVDHPIRGKIFDARGDIYSSIDHGFRYVFFNGKIKFIIIETSNPGAWSPDSQEAQEKSRQNESFLDAVANTFRFID